MTLPLFQDQTIDKEWLTRVLETPYDRESRLELAYLLLQNGQRQLLDFVVERLPFADMMRIEMARLGWKVD